MDRFSILHLLQYDLTYSMRSDDQMRDTVPIWAIDYMVKILVSPDVICKLY